MSTRAFGVARQKAMELCGHLLHGARQVAVEIESIDRAMEVHLARERSDQAKMLERLRIAKVESGQLQRKLRDMHAKAVLLDAEVCRMEMEVRVDSEACR